MVGGMLAPVGLYPWQNDIVNLEKATNGLFADSTGSATLFCSFSAAETKWIKLYKML